RWLEAVVHRAQRERREEPGAPVVELGPPEIGEDEEEPSEEPSGKAEGVAVVQPAEAQVEDAPGEDEERLHQGGVLGVLAPDGVDAARVERPRPIRVRSEEHTSELQSLRHLVCRLLLEKKKQRAEE